MVSWSIQISRQKCKKSMTKTAKIDTLSLFMIKMAEKNIPVRTANTYMAHMMEWIFFVWCMLQSLFFEEQKEAIRDRKLNQVNSL